MRTRPARPELVGVALPVGLAQLAAPLALAPLRVVHCLSRWRLRPVSGCLLGCGAARLLLPPVRAGCLSCPRAAAGCCRYAHVACPYGCAPLGWLSRVASMALWSLALIATRASCVSPAAFYGSIRIATGAAAMFELGDVRTSFVMRRRGNQGQSLSTKRYGLQPHSPGSHSFGSKPLRQFCQSYATAARHTAAQQ